MEKRIPISSYGEFYDYPRQVVLHFGQKWFYLSSAFDEAKDAYPDFYDVYVLPFRDEEELKANSYFWVWGNLSTSKHLSRISIVELGLDESRRRSIDGEAFAKWLEARKRRIESCRVGLLQFWLYPSDDGEPTWSSRLMDELIVSVMGVPEASPGEMLEALYSVLTDEKGKLTETVGHLIKDVVIGLLCRNRDMYDQVDLRWMAQSIMQGATPAQAYLSVFASAPTMSKECAREILRKLHGTCKEEEARKLLEDNPQD